MSVPNLPDDDELRRLFTARFISGLRPDVGVAILVYEHFGTKPPSSTKREALFAVNDHRAKGATIADALRAVLKERGVVNVTETEFLSLKRSYERFRKIDLRDHFYSSALAGDFDGAIEALKFCNDEIRQEILRLLNGDSPPVRTP